MLRGIPVIEKELKWLILAWTTERGVIFNTEDHMGPPLKIKILKSLASQVADISVNNQIAIFLDPPPPQKIKI